MECPECSSIMHKDSNSVCACISCGYREERLTSTCGASYNNAGLLQGEEPKHIRYEGKERTNDAGEKSQSVEATLKQRGNRYGEFKNHAQLSQKLKIVFDDHVNDHGNPSEFTPVMSESIEMIFHKLARIANGDPTYIDNYVDIAGYAQLAVDDMNASEKSE